MIVSQLARLIAYWLNDRRRRTVRIDWQLTTFDTHIQLKRLYPEMTI